MPDCHVICYEGIMNKCSFDHRLWIFHYFSLKSFQNVNRSKSFLVQFKKDEKRNQIKWISLDVSNVARSKKGLSGVSQKYLTVPLHEIHISYWTLSKKDKTKYLCDAQTGKVWLFFRDKIASTVSQVLWYTNKYLEQMST